MSDWGHVVNLERSSYCPAVAAGVVVTAQHSHSHYGGDRQPLWRELAELRRREVRAVRLLHLPPASARIQRKG